MIYSLLYFFNDLTTFIVKKIKLLWINWVLENKVHILNKYWVCLFILLYILINIPYIFWKEQWTFLHLESPVLIFLRIETCSPQIDSFLLLKKVKLKSYLFCLLVKYLWNLGCFSNSKWSFGRSHLQAFSLQHIHSYLSCLVEILKIYAI